MQKAEDIVIYCDDVYYAAFPSVVTCDDGELLLAFRRAPDRRPYFSDGYTHCDPNSYLVMIRSADHGRSWTADPELIHAHTHGGSQDPCMVLLDDGSLVVTSYAWMLLPQGGIEHESRGRHVVFGNWHFTFLGGYMMRSADRGKSWEGPILPPQLDGEANFFPGVPIPAMNRGAMVQGRDDGILYWAVCRSPE